MERRSTVALVARASVAAATLFALPNAASAKSYFCAPKPVKLGSYRPDESSPEVDINVSVRDAFDFWFDDMNGDFISYEKGTIGPLRRGLIELPIPARKYLDYPSVVVNYAVMANQCVIAPMGVLPAAAQRAPNE